MSFLPQSRDRLNNELYQEMESHVYEKADTLESAGMSRAEALAEARRTFGNQARLQDESRSMASNWLIDAVVTDLQFALAQLRRSPLYAFAAVIILGFGIGANTAIFSVLYEATFRLLPVRAPERLALMRLNGPKLPASGAALTLRMFDGLRERQQSFDDVSGWVGQDRVTFEDEVGRPHTMRASLVSGNAFDTLGILPEAGRLLTTADDHADPSKWPVVLSNTLWEQKYQRDPSAIGRLIRVSGQAVQIVGIAPANFEGLTPNLSPEMYLPLRFLNAQKIGGGELLNRADFFGITVLGRLREGVTLASADVDLSASANEFFQAEIAPQLLKHPDLRGAMLQVTDGSHGLRVLASYRSTLTLLQLLTGAGLLFCCANVSGLQMARRIERAHEFAVRTALGAGQNHLVRQSLAESFLIAFGGALLALPITFAVSRTLGTFLTDPGAGDIITVSPDWTVFAIAGTFAVICAIVVGMVPVYLARNVLPADVLRPRATSRRTTLTASRLILTSQVTITFLLLAVAASSVRSLRALYSNDLGYDPRYVTEICAQFHELQKSPDEVMSIYRRMLHALNAQRDIDAATITWITQLTNVGPTLDANATGSSRVLRLSFNAIGPSYFATLKTPLLDGREFIDEDTTDQHCIVNDLAANLLFHTNVSAVVGRKLTLQRDADLHTTCSIVGVVQATKFADVHESKAPIVFLPITSSFMRMGEGNMVFLLRGVHEASKEAAYLKVLADVAPGTGYLRFLPMERQLSDALGRERLVAYIAILFATTALLLCGMSGFSLLQMRVLQNTPQIALRVALGATPWQAARMVLGEVAVVTFASLCMGSFALRMFWQSVQRLLHLNSPFSRGDGLVALSLITLMMLCAGGLPAIRAGTLHPLRALRRDT